MVCRYFDTYFEAIIAEKLTEEEAKKRANDLNKTSRCYVEFLVRPQIEKKMLTN